MIILSSPAKTQDFETEWSSVVQSNPEFIAEAAGIAAVLQKMSKSSLAKVMRISQKLSDINYERYQSWSIEKHTKNGKPAILAYKGDIFKQMNPDAYNSDQQLYAHHSTRFLTGLYGMLRAYDLMLPYRLEMKTSVSVGAAKDLYQFWQKKLTASLNRDLAAEKNPLLVDAASAEYSKPVDFEAISHPWVRIEFRENEKTGLRNVGFFSKKARGMLLEYCITHQVSTLAELKKFDLDGYRFHSQSEHQVLFVR